jgi:hypothetical protein
MVGTLCAALAMLCCVVPHVCCGLQLACHRLAISSYSSLSAPCCLHLALPSLDPGTTNFVHRFPFSCVSIGLTIGKEPVVGVVLNPILNEVYHAGGFTLWLDAWVSHTAAVAPCFTLGAKVSAQLLHILFWCPAARGGFQGPVARWLGAPALFNVP